MRQRSSGAMPQITGPLHVLPAARMGRWCPVLPQIMAHYLWEDFRPRPPSTPHQPPTRHNEGLAHDLTWMFLKPLIPAAEAPPLCLTSGNATATLGKTTASQDASAATTHSIIIIIRRQFPRGASVPCRLGCPRPSFPCELADHSPRSWPTGVRK